MKKILPTWQQSLWIIAAVILMIGGIISLSVKSEKLIGTAYLLGLAMLFSGSINIIIHRKCKGKLHGSRWFLADGMCTVFLSFFPIFNKMIMPVMIPFFFGVWEIVSGVMKLIDSSELREEDIKPWRKFMTVGIIELLSGIASIIKPVDDLLGFNVVIAVIMFVQSSGFILKAIYYDTLTEKEKKV